MRYKKTKVLLLWACWRISIQTQHACTYIHSNETETSCVINDSLMFKTPRWTAGNRLPCSYHRFGPNWKHLSFPISQSWIPIIRFIMGLVFLFILAVSSWNWKYVLICFAAMLCSYGQFYPLSHFRQLWFSPACEALSIGVLRQRPLSTDAVRDAGKNTWVHERLSLLLMFKLPTMVNWVMHSPFIPCPKVCFILWTKVFTFWCVRLS